MYFKKKITLVFFFVGCSLIGFHSCFAIAQTERVTITQNNDTQPSEGYDSFDSYAHDVGNLDLQSQEPEQQSFFNYWLLKICTPLVMNYLALKGHMRNFCFWVVGRRKIKRLKPKKTDI